MRIYGPMGELLHPDGPWYALVRDMDESRVTHWRVLCSGESNSAVESEVKEYVANADHDVQWQIAEQQSEIAGGVIVLALPNGVLSDVKICEVCATLIGQGRAWKQVFGPGKCGACDATLI